MNPDELDDVACYNIIKAHTGLNQIQVGAELWYKPEPSELDAALRAENPALQDAWERYQAVKKLVEK